jgi:hypothetical protein
VLEVPHERRGVEEVDGGDAYGIGGVQAQETSLCDGNAGGAMQLGIDLEGDEFLFKLPRHPLQLGRKNE